MDPNRPDQEDPSEPPPLLGTWSRLYAAELGFLAALIALFWWFGRKFTP